MSYNGYYGNGGWGHPPPNNAWGPPPGQYGGPPPPHPQQQRGWGGDPYYGNGGGNYPPVRDQYPPPPQQQHYHQQPPPPPQSPFGQAQYPPPVEELRAPPEVATDPNAFRQFFAYHLANHLTYNSKPAITQLTMMAQKHVHRMASVVASCLDEHLRTCPPPSRLPALYLLDSISKNVNAPYTALFSRFIERAFLSAYAVVDLPTKTKLEELLGTWRTGGPDGGELFRAPDESTGRGGRVQRGIETALFGQGGKGGGIGGRPASAAQEYQSGVKQLPSSATQDERTGVLHDVRRLLTLRLDQQQRDPSDEVNNSQIAALRTLEHLVSDTQLTSDQVSRIRGQLAALAPAEQTTPSIPSASSLHAPSAIDPNLLARLQAQLGGSAGLFETPPGTPPLVKREPVDPVVKAYDDAILALDLGDVITTASLLKLRNDSASFLYGRLGSQCPQCGLRFLDSPAGTKARDAHLDWHFRHKKRVSEGSARTQGRSWFAPIDEWLASDVYDGETANVGGIKNEEGVGGMKIDRKELMQRRVVAPPGDPPICPICKEAFKSELSEEDEEWVFWNAEEIDGVIYHAICRAEAAQTAQKSAAAPMTPREGTPSLGGGFLGGGSAQKRKLEPDVEDESFKRVKSEIDV